MAYDFVRGLIDVRGKLARSAAPGHGPQKKEPLSAKVGVVAHYNGPACPNTWQQIVNDARYHVDKDWGGAYGDGLMYHVAIGPNGEKWLCRDLEAVLWHVGAWPENGTWWAMAFPIGERQRATAAQIKAGAEVASDLLAYSKRGREYLKGHKEISASSCPGSLMPDLVLPFRAGKLVPAPVKKPAPPVQPAKPTPDALYRVRCGSFRERNNADALAARLKKAGYGGVALLEDGAFNVYAGSFSVRQNAEKLAAELRRKGFEAVVVQKGVPSKPAPTKPPPKPPADDLSRDVEEAIEFGRQIVGAPYGTGWEEGTWPALSPLYAKIGSHDPPSYYRSRYIVCSGLINVLRYEIAGLPAIGRAQGDAYPGGTAAIGRTLAKMPGCKPYPPVANTPRGWLVFSPYLGSRLALQGHVGVALGDGRVLEARVPNASENRTENDGCRALVAGGGKPYTTIIPPEIWLRK